MSHAKVTRKGPHNLILGTIVRVAHIFPDGNVRVIVQDQAVAHVPLACLTSVQVIKGGTLSKLCENAYPLLTADQASALTSTLEDPCNAYGAVLRYLQTLGIEVL